MAKINGKKPAKTVAKTAPSNVGVGAAGKGASPATIPVSGVKTTAPNRSANLGSWLHPKKK